MTTTQKPVAIAALSAPAETRTIYPAPFAERVKGRERRRLGEQFGLKNFGVNLTRLAPGAVSALKHRHSRQDEFVYVLVGHPVLVTGQEETPLSPGDCAGFAAAGPSHQLLNRGTTEVLYLEVGDRTAGDQVEYPDDDLAAVLGPDGRWRVSHKDGRPY